MYGTISCQPKSPTKESFHQQRIWVEKLTTEMCEEHEGKYELFLLNNTGVCPLALTCHSTGKTLGMTSVNTISQSKS